MKVARLLVSALLFIPGRIAATGRNVATALVQIWANKARSMLTVLGVRLAETLRARQRLAHLPALGVAALMRLIVSPALAFLFASLVGLAGIARDVTVLQSAMPTAVITTILATEFDSDPPFAALCVLATTLLSLPTLTILLNLLMP